MSSKTLILEENIDSHFGSVSLSKRLVRSMSQKFKRKEINCEDSHEKETTNISSRCVPLYSRAGGCKVGADMGEDAGDPTSSRSDASDEGKGYTYGCGKDIGATIDCFPYSMRDKLFKRHTRKTLTYKGCSVESNTINARFPDDILEMCLVRLPLSSLMNARLVCRKWRSLTSTPRFMRVRREGLFQSPWLFLLGIVKDGYCSGEMHVLDISLEKWHSIDSPILKGRFMFSVACIQEEIYVVGGCSSLYNTFRVDRNSCKTHKGVVVFSPLMKSWRKAASMKYARSSPILGVAEVNQDSFVFRNHRNQAERRLYRARVGGASDVYEDPHRLSLRCQPRDSFDGNDVSSVTSAKLMKQKAESSSIKDCKKCIMLVVGGLGSWDEPLDTGEIYDPVSNKWTEIQRLPLDFGRPCSGTVCRGVFYVYSETDKLIGYDIERGYWIRIQATPSSPRVQEYYPKLVSSNGRLLMLCVLWCEGEGQIGRRNKAVRKLWELDFTQLSWKEVSTHPDAPMDWNASFVADKQLIFGVEIFKIFGRVLDFVTIFNVSDASRGWNHIWRNHVTNDLDASSCITKALAVLHL